MAHIPHCITTERCDACENLFLEIITCPFRYVFPCGHVFCRPCLRNFQARAEPKPERPATLTTCPRCPSTLVRRTNNWRCNHPILVAEFLQEAYQRGDDVIATQFQARIGRPLQETCQRCALSFELQRYSMRVTGEMMLGDFPGEVYACVHINGYLVHGMVREPRHAVVDLVNDAEMPRASKLNEEDALHLTTFLASFTMEPHFVPLGRLEVTYRLRGFKAWADRLPATDLEHLAFTEMVRIWQDAKQRHDGQAGQ